VFEAPPSDDAVWVVPDVAELRSIGLAHGLDVVGVASAERFTSTRHDLESRKARGLHGGMAFTYRSPERSTDPSRTVADARSLVVGARSYWRADPPEDQPARPAATVARYARVDHYAPLRAALAAIAARLRDEGWRALVVADDNALVDRAAAQRAGLGWFGKNANLLLPGRGSWFVLGSVITDAPLDDQVDTAPVADGCGSCIRCLEGCPTGAIVAPGVVDARRCMAWLLQAEGDFPREFRSALGDRIYGCDECQEVCPPNRRATRRAAEDPASSGEGEQARVDVLDLLVASDEELLDRHGRWYIPRRDPRFLRRNGLVVLGNVGRAADAGVTDALRRYLASPDPLLRGHAVWAARRLGRVDLLSAVREDPDPSVRDELTQPVEVRR
jgi:epoxyqueuosine reductase